MGATFAHSFGQYYTSSLGHLIEGINKQTSTFGEEESVRPARKCTPAILCNFIAKIVELQVARSPLLPHLAPCEFFRFTNRKKLK